MWVCGYPYAVRVQFEDKALTRWYGSSVIGLSIVKAIMDSVPGAVNYENGVAF